METAPTNKKFLVFISEPTPFLQINGVKNAFQKTVGYDTEEEARVALADVVTHLENTERAIWSAYTGVFPENEQTYIDLRSSILNDPTRHTWDCVIGTAGWLLGVTTNPLFDIIENMPNGGAVDLE